jgi:bifunctional non-homologous end joining protein LigD
MRDRAGSHSRARTALANLVGKLRDVQLATLVKEIPAGAWIYELKWDGYRILAYKRGQDVCLMSRRANDWTADFRVVAEAVARLPAKECIIDGEVCAMSPKGVPSFQLLQNRRSGNAANLLFIVFDLLWIDGEDLRPRPIEERRARLERIMVDASANTLVRLSTAVEGDAKQILATACKAGLEGIVAKKKGSRYSGTRDQTWLKVKCTLRQEFAVVGYMPLGKTLPAVGSLLLALMGDDGDLHYAGKVGTGFDDKTRTALAKLLEIDRSPQPTASGAPKLGGLARWSKPKYVAEVEFTEWTDAGDIRHPSFRGLRKDKKPEECVRERPATVTAPDARGRRRAPE